MGHLSPVSSGGSGSPWFAVCRLKVIVSPCLLQAICRHCHARGIDYEDAVADRVRSQAISPAGREALAPHIAEQAFGDLVVVPCYPGMPDKEPVRSAKAIKEAAAGTGRTTGCASAAPGEPAQARAG